MSEKPLECTSCGKLKDYGEPHNFYDCVQYLKGVIRAKDAQIGDMQASLDGLDDQPTVEEELAAAVAINRQLRTTLQAKDAQIAMLVRALRDIAEISSAMGDPFRQAKVIARKAIKEAGE